MIDVIVLGGGPGGSVCAAQLARRGMSVVLLEKASFPRFHLGESLLPKSLDVLDEIGALPAVSAAFQPKYGARFHDPNRNERFDFASAWKPERDHAFQVPRDAFDRLLLDHARALGVDVREGTAAKKVEGTTVDGLTARFVVDATGRDALITRPSMTKIEGLDQTALYAHYENVPRQEGRLAGDIDIVLFGERSWFWFIPFKDGRTSVGAVVSRAFIRERKGDASELFAAAVAEAPAAQKLLADARCLWPHTEAAADFSYRVRRMSGRGWVAVGDAGGFIDPLFSTGVHLAMTGGMFAADAIVAALASPESEAVILGAWEAHMRTATETFILAVQAFYAGPLVEFIFSADKHPSLRRSITSLLAGDVFGDSIWLRDIRLRLQELG